MQQTIFIVYNSEVDDIEKWDMSDYFNTVLAYYGIYILEDFQKSV
ncbi:hypothetical protein T01_5697 [Trichinella spiralis]|uniref:Uncharacterized protein n=1 Tax=Trichinella spiralis TaxID=6334 RepID=A0A0V1AJ12_TRISP|nr:hypothetical protein T01_5697 [Trichinella spiralis]